MISHGEDIPPPIRLSLAYAPDAVKAAYGLLLQIDARFSKILANSKEPMIGQMKLAWWRDAVKAEAVNRPKGEPLLSGLSTLNNDKITQAALSLADGWEILLVEEIWNTPVLEQFAQARGRAVFTTYTELCGLPKIDNTLAAEWALNDLRHRFGSRVAGNMPANAPLPRSRALRPLTILAMSVRTVTGPRLIWHALTGM